MRFQRSGTIFLIFAATALLAGCQSASLEDAAPRTISPIPLKQNNNAPELARKDFVSQGAANNGQFPNVGEERRAALPQMSEGEAQALKAEFATVGSAARMPGESEAAYQRRLAELRRIARTHESEAERQIEQ